MAEPNLSPAIGAIVSWAINRFGKDVEMRREDLRRNAPDLSEHEFDQAVSELEARGFRIIDGTSEPAREETPARKPPAAPKPGDPILDGQGRSLDFASLRNYRWAKDQPYLSNSLIHLFEETARQNVAAGSGRYEMTAGDLVATILSDDQRISSASIGCIGKWARDRKLAEPREPRVEVRNPEVVILRWDVVDILSEAANIRSRLMAGEGPMATRHLAVALVRSRTGQAALSSAGLLDNGVGPIAEVLVHMAWATSKSKSANRGWPPIIDELRVQKLLVSNRIEARMAYSSDRAARPAKDVLGVSADAQILADLILLKSAQPPLAIGIFGAWGSGKSTLMKELQHRVSSNLREEADQIASGTQDRNAETQQIGNAVQIEFNAWAYTDSQNLWASLTSEIFDQLASGGLSDDSDTGTANYAGLVEIVKKRSSRDAAPLKAGEVAISDLERQVEVAAAKVNTEQTNRRMAASDAAFATAKELLKNEHQGGGGTQYVVLGKKPKEADEKAIDLVRTALSGGDKFEAQVQAYVESGGAIARMARLVWDYARARQWPLVALTICLCAIGLIGFMPEFAKSLIQKFGWAYENVKTFLAASGAVGFLAFAWSAAPAFRVAALFTQSLREQRADAAQAEVAARVELRELEVKLEQARSTVEQARSLADKYAAAKNEGTNAASPSLMLEYLLSESEDVHALRQQLGIIAKVRRCFEQLDAVISEIRKKGTPGALERIILYIDDLDRCDPDQVSQVLQAVHLLLAFECFVVVVAVDARWLKQSLERSKAQLADPAAKTAEFPAPDSGKIAREPTSDDAPVSAADYLEKIFQIPFWVQPLIDRDAPEEDRYLAYRDFVNSIVRPEATETPTAPDVGEEPKPTASFGPSQLAWTEPHRMAQSEEPRRERLKLHDQEALLMAELGPLAAKSPRAVKQMINLYRLARLRYRGEQLTAFLGDGASSVPSYRELMFALACELGLSPVARRKLRESVAEPGDANVSWSPDTLENAYTAEELKKIKLVAPKLGGLTSRGMMSAFEEVRRYSFLP